eukprot:1138393-Pelagomonas_calceolata.AAC.3
MATAVTVLLLGGLELVLSPGENTRSCFHIDIHPQGCTFVLKRAGYYLIPAYASNRTLPSYLFHCYLSMRDRSTSSQPDAILITPHNAQPTPNNVSSSCSHHAPRSRHCTTQRSGTANHVRQPHQLHAKQRHVHLIEIKYCEDTRPQHQLDAAKQQHADLSRLISAKAVTIHPILLGVGWTIYTEHTLKQFKQLGLDHQ